MAVLHALGIDSTLIPLFILAYFAFFALSVLVYKPYTDALIEREKRTKGGEQAANQLLQQTSALRAQYEQKAREMSGQVKTIFDSYRQDAAKDYDLLVSQARAESQKIIEEARQKITAQIAEATQKMQEEIPFVAQAMAAKVLSRRGEAK